MVTRKRGNCAEDQGLAGAVRSVPPGSRWTSALWSSPKSAHCLRSCQLLLMIPSGSAGKTCSPWGSFGLLSPTPGGRSH